MKKRIRKELERRIREHGEVIDRIKEMKSWPENARRETMEEYKYRSGAVTAYEAVLTMLDASDHKASVARLDAA